jgi:hypothetical protein
MMGWEANEGVRSQCAAAFGRHGARRAGARLPWCKVSSRERGAGFGRHSLCP